MVVAIGATGGAYSSQLHLQNLRVKYRSAKIGYGMGISTAILRTSRALHKEAETFLYRLHELDFHAEISVVIPFLRSLSNNARQNISCLTMDLVNTACTRPGRFIGLCRPNLFDWGLVCSYIGCHVRLREFAFHIESEAPEDFQDLGWIHDMVQIKGLQKLTYYERKEKNGYEELEYLGREDEDRLTTVVSDKIQGLLSYLRPRMLKAPTTNF